MLFVAGVVILLVLSIGLWLKASWHDSVWRIDQVSAIERIEKLIMKVDELANLPESGVERSQVGDLAQDWQLVKSELQSYHGLRSWWQGGRKDHTLEDSRARALWTLAFKRVKPLLIEIAGQEGKRLSATTLDHIFDVLSVNLDDLASNVIKMSPSVEVETPQSSDTLAS